MYSCPVRGGNITSQISRESLTLEEATNLIIERARQLVDKLVEDRGHDRPPFLPQEFACLAGIKKIVRTNLGQTSAELLKSYDGYVIRVNEKHYFTRQNFSCAHEIGHALFRELKLQRYIEAIEYHVKAVEYRKFNPLGEKEARVTAIERLCDSAATELLMPESVFRKYLSNFGLSISAVEHLANTFRVSIQAAAIRIAEVSIEPCITLLWKHQPRNASKSLELGWCIGPGIKFLNKTNYTPIHTNIRYPSVLYKAYEYDRPVKGYKKFKRGTEEQRLPMESKGFGFGETRYVISLAFLNR